MPVQAVPREVREILVNDTRESLDWIRIVEHLCSGASVSRSCPAWSRVEEEAAFQAMVLPGFTPSTADLCLRDDRSVSYVAKDCDQAETAVRDGIHQGEVNVGERYGLASDEHAGPGRLRQELRRLSEVVDGGLCTTVNPNSQRSPSASLSAGWTK